MKNDWEDKGGETVVGMCHMREESILNLKKNERKQCHMVLLDIYDINVYIQDFINEK